MPTTTTGAIPTLCVSCAVERDTAQPFMFTFADVYQAFLSCRRGKRATRKAQRYEVRLLDHLSDTVDALNDGTWHPSRASRFVVTHPKPREILAATFADRVVHHLIVPWFERHFEPVFIHDSFANRKGRGTHAAVLRLQQMTRQHTPRHRRGDHADRCRSLHSAATSREEREAGPPNVVAHLDWAAVPLAAARVADANAHASGPSDGRHYLQLDIANFFNTIHRPTLFALLRDRLKRDLRRPATDPRHAVEAEARAYLAVARRILTGNPAEGADFHGDPRTLHRVPPHKCLGNAPAATGLPIGNLTSQFFANVYLNELDQFVKHTLKVKHYVRYVDDFVLLGDSPETLAQWRAAIAAFLAGRLRLKLRDAGTILPVRNGVNFLGYIVRPDYLLVRQRVLGHLREKLGRYHLAVCGAAANDGALPPRWQVSAVLRARISATVNSYRAHCQHARVGRLYAQLLIEFPWLQLFGVQPSPDAAGADRLCPIRAQSLPAQIAHFRQQFADAVCFIEIGRQVYAYPPKAVLGAVFLPFKGWADRSLKAGSPHCEHPPTRGTTGTRRTRVTTTVRAASARLSLTPLAAAGLRRSLGRGGVSWVWVTEGRPLQARLKARHAVRGLGYGPAAPPWPRTPPTANSAATSPPLSLPT